MAFEESGLCWTAVRNGYTAGPYAIERPRHTASVNTHGWRAHRTVPYVCLGEWATWQQAAYACESDALRSVGLTKNVVS